MDHYTPFGPNIDGTAKSAEPDPEPDPENDEPSQADYLKSIMPARPTRSKLPMLVALVVAVLLLAGGGYYLFAHKSKSTANQTTKKSQNVVADTTSGSSPLTRYTSNGQDLNLNFDYPANWSVSPPSNSNSNDQAITVTSPLSSLSDAGGTGVIGKVEVFIRPGNAQLNELSNGATAAQTSTQIAYSRPTTAQHQYPFLTYLHLGSGNSTTFQEVIVTGVQQMNAGQSVSSSSIQADPVISASFYSCGAQVCTGSEAVPLPITNDEWQNTALYQQALAIIQSMQLN